jgi:hypothetical protein
MELQMIAENMTATLSSEKKLNAGQHSLSQTILLHLLPGLLITLVFVAPQHE